MLRNLIFLGMAVGAASMAGWLTIDRQGDQTTIQINRSEIRSDARRAIDRGRTYLDQRDASRGEEPAQYPGRYDQVGYQEDGHAYQGPGSQDPGYGGGVDHRYPPGGYAPTSPPGNWYPTGSYSDGYDGSARYQPPSYPDQNHYYPASHTYPSDPRR